MQYGTPIDKTTPTPQTKSNNGIKIFTGLALVLGIGFTAILFKPKSKKGESAEIIDFDEKKKSKQEIADHEKEKLTPAQIMQKKSVEARRKKKAAKEAKKLEENNDSAV